MEFKKKIIKWLKPFSIKGLHPLRFLNPFTSKRFDLEKLYNTIYLFNKLTKTDFKPIPYSKKLTEIEKNINKGIVESIIYELRILFGSYTIIILIYMFWLFTNGLDISLYHSIILGVLVFLFCVMIKITIKIMNSSCKINTDTQIDLIEQFHDCNLNISNNECKNTVEPKEDQKTIVNKIQTKKRFRYILNKAYRLFNARNINKR